MATSAVASVLGGKRLLPESPSGLPTHDDCTSGYRCYTRELLLEIGLDEVVSQGYSFQIVDGFTWIGCGPGYRGR